MGLSGQNGLGDVWLQQGVEHVIRSVLVFRQRLIDRLFQQSWKPLLEKKNVLGFVRFSNRVSPCLLVNHGPSQQSSKEENKA